MPLDYARRDGAGRKRKRNAKCYNDSDNASDDGSDYEHTDRNDGSAYETD